jgi:hypothetical protein
MASGEDPLNISLPWRTTGGSSIELPPFVFMKRSEAEAMPPVM